MSGTEQLLAVTPLDGRYADKVQELGEITSEYGLMRYRAVVEVEWLDTLGSGVLPDVPAMSDVQREKLADIKDGFSLEDAKRIKEIEKTTNHDVKAAENWLRERLHGDETFEDYMELTHFGLTSEDVNNLAYAFMLRDARDKVLLPGIAKAEGDLTGKAGEYADVPLLARTHGQPATPTTLGKEMAVFANRLGRSAERLGGVAILGKLNGASGNYNAVTFAYPEVDWPSVSRAFVQGMGFEFNTHTTQIEPHDWMAAYANELALSNSIMTDLARDMWMYISNGTFKLRVVAGEVGSSTMPHKVNPIDFENAESNFGTANALLGSLAARLPISRLQRDLSDSSTQRTIGEALGHTVVGHKGLMRGLGKVGPDTEAIKGELDGEWSVLTEAVQTVMRRHKVSGAYEAIKAVSRGKSLDKDGYLELVEQLELPEDAKTRLRDLTPQTYLGHAADLARS
jgi:adenylosuccinate lyase